MRSRIVDGDVRLTYAAMVRRDLRGRRRPSTASASSPAITSSPLLQNRWEMATLHWACQFAGHRDHADQLARQGRRARLLHRERRGPRDRLRGCLGRGGRRELGAAQAGCRVLSVDRETARTGAISFCRSDRGRARRTPTPRVGADAWSLHALHVRHDRQAEGRAAPAPRRTRRGARPCRAESLRPRRAHARRHAALPHDGRALAAGDVADRRQLRLPAALRRRQRAAR